MKLNISDISLKYILFPYNLNKNTLNENQLGKTLKDIQYYIQKLANHVM